MKPINKSASKIVFLIITITSCVAFLFGVLTGKVLLETKDFLPLVAMAFTYYFTRSGTDRSQDTNAIKPIVVSDKDGV